MNNADCIPLPLGEHRGLIVRLFKRLLDKLYLPPSRSDLSQSFFFYIERKFLHSLENILSSSELWSCVFAQTSSECFCAGTLALCLARLLALVWREWRGSAFSITMLILAKLEIEGSGEQPFHNNSACKMTSINLRIICSPEGVSLVWLRFFLEVSSPASSDVGETWKET